MSSSKLKFILLEFKKRNPFERCQYLEEVDGSTISWNSISKLDDIDMEFITKFIKKIKPCILFRYQKFDHNEIFCLLNLFDEYHNYISMKKIFNTIFRFQTLSSESIQWFMSEPNLGEYLFNILLKYQKLSEGIILYIVERTNNVYRMGVLLKYYSLSEDLMTKIISKVKQHGNQSTIERCFHQIATKQKISENFIKKYQDYFQFSWLVKNKNLEVSKEFKKEIRHFAKFEKLMRSMNGSKNRL